jgi:two-component system response regulator AtoC
MKLGKTEGTILLADDELEVRNYLELALKCQGYSVELAQDGDEVLSCLRARVPVSAVLLDLVMNTRDGMDTLRQIRQFDKNLPVIIISGASSPGNVVEAMNSGATDFLGKPVPPQELERAIKKALANRVPIPISDKKPIMKAVLPKETFYGKNPQMREIEALVPEIGWSEAPVLIQGETGVGKEVIARALHAHSPRAGKPLLKLNCAALPSELVESELFGYERGAFTGAFQKKLGMFELADGGTILLDEIGDMDYGLQAKLLQVLQDHEFQRVGGKETIAVDVRVVAATHRDLEQAIIERTFRKDLYYRLNVVNLQIPALRERKEDIIVLAELLMRKCAQAGKPIPPITPTLQEAMLLYNWPGNVRELENVMRKLIILGNPDVIATEIRALAERDKLRGRKLQLSDAKTHSETEATILEQVTRAKTHAEITAIRAALDSTMWNRKQAATLLKVDYKVLLYKMKKLGIEDDAITFKSAPRPKSGDDSTVKGFDSEQD